MPNKRVLVRNYSISDGTIIQLADAIGNTVTRDMADLSVYGITPATVTELETLREDFANLLDDAYYVGMQLSATESKNKIRDELETTVRSLATRAEIKLGTKSPNWALRPRGHIAGNGRKAFAHRQTCSSYGNIVSTRPGLRRH
ncbi:MAG: hypothetical protein SH856_14835 [Flavobacteriales bacterium]|nr:hypothetical protein [Flavobacteriales bacterium]